MFEEIKKLKDLLAWWAAVMALTTCFFFFFGLTTVDLFGRNIPVPLPSNHSLSVQFFQKMQADLLPNGVTLVAMTPFSALNTQITVAALLAFLATFPFLLYRAVGYVFPALYADERRSLLMVLLPAVALFAGGALFAYRIVIPPTLDALYGYTASTGVMAIFSIDAFVTFLVTFMLVTGILFLLPIFMALLSFLGIIPPRFWRERWRYALLTFLVFSAIITPDGSGISMILLSLPLGGLYAVGVGVSSIERTFNSVHRH